MQRLTFILIVCFFSIHAQAQIFVDDDATGNNDGTNWTDAFTDLQDALAASTSGDEIWVARGRYYPSQDNDRFVSFEMVEGVKLYGGFQGNEQALTQRDWNFHLSILDGNIGDPNDIEDNSISVIRNKGTGLTNEAVIDGFVISHGNCNLPEPYERGGGMFNKDASPHIRNCVFRDNYGQYGAGLYNLDGSNPVIEHCVFNDNIATVAGGGVYNFLNCEPLLFNCKIQGNVGASKTGGGLYNFLSHPKVVNCLITGNRAAFGAAVYNTNGSNPEVINCTLSGNMADTLCGGIFNVSSDPIIINTIIWSNSQWIPSTNEDKNLYYEFGESPRISYSLVTHYNFNDTTCLAGHLDPKFQHDIPPQAAPCSGGDYWIGFDYSPIINRGNNAANDFATSLTGGTRIAGGVIDLGAYEWASTTGIESSQEDQIVVFPNPVQAFLHIKGVVDCNVIIYDVNGQIVLQKKIYDEKLDVANLPSGVYSLFLPDLRQLQQFVKL